ncbi:InlB B-repeat-containing protein, partial [Amycolatopsis sp. SID8362]|uniref:InlB B-repeat-containing protein n=1 Tax=Amycolatopsis sp. SID8362 TaxID=2690346 RepID=UPI00142C5111
AATGVGGGGSGSRGIGAAGGKVTIGRGAVVQATSGPGASSVVGSNGGTPYGTVSNSGTLTLTGNQTNYGTLTNTATGLITVNTRMAGTGQVTNDGTIRLANGAFVFYEEAHIEHHAFLVGYSPSRPNSPSQVLAATYDAAQVPLPAPPAGQAWYSTKTCIGQQVVDKSTDLPAVFGSQTASPDTDDAASGTLKPNVTLYAKAKAAVTFDATGGSPTPSAQTVVSGCTATKPAAPTRTGYTFDGWSSTKDGSPYDFSTPVTKDLTLYAHWTAAADLTVGLSATAGQFLLPDLKFTATTGNNGPGTADNTSLHMTYPSGLGNVTPDDRAACTVDTSTRTITCDLGSLPTGTNSTHTVTFQAELLALGTQTVTATVNSTTPDPNFANNTASASCTVVARLSATC